ncbi:MAG TPA: MG2 domain-containing protein [Chitinispirillaceae bacterium]|nr:MG2 domain-containing protein [Chitinispirillaceae bacterium]
MNNRLNIIAAVITIALSASCTKDEYDHSDTHLLGINKYTCGTFINSEPIQIAFSNKVNINPMLINVPLPDSPFSFNPDIEGAAIWINDSTLQFIPSHKLKGGQTYTASLNIKAFQETLEGKFIFSFTPVEKSFDLIFDELKASSHDNLAYQKLEGEIITSDKEEIINIENIVSAFQNNKRLNIIYKNPNGPKSYPFIIDSILRKDTPSQITVFWDGKPIGIETKGEHSVQVPSIHSFFVISAHSVQGETCYVEVRFNDPLDPDQNLNGLIRAGSKSNESFIINNNVVRIFNNSGWAGTVGIQVEHGIRNSIGKELREPWHGLVFFEELPARLDFCDSGLIVPFLDNPTLPVHAVNIDKIKIEAFEIFENTISQFFQINDFFGKNELERVGKVIWTKEILLDSDKEKSNRIKRYEISIKPLLEKQNSRFFRIRLSYSHPEKDNSDTILIPGKNELTKISRSKKAKKSFRPLNEFMEDKNLKTLPEDQGNHDKEISVYRNILVSDIGITAKLLNNNVINIVTTSLTTASPLPLVKINIFDYQQQIVASGKTDSEGLLTLSTKGKPFLIAASKGNQKSYLPINLQVSEKDTVAIPESASKSIDGFIYCERGIRRAGDTLYVTFILHDRYNQMDQTKPVILDLKDSENNPVYNTQTSQSLNGFYVFRIPTSSSSPDGLWNLQIQAGNSMFEKKIRVGKYSDISRQNVLEFGETIITSFNSCSLNQNFIPVNKAPSSVKINKTRFVTGDTVSISVQSQTSDYILVNIENSKDLIKQKWIQSKNNQTNFKFKAEHGMIPGVEIKLTLFNPLSVIKNGFPVKTCGTIPVTVIDPSIIITPTIEISEIPGKNDKTEIKISERSGKNMTYTIAIVDEYQLRMSGFQTPNPRNHFYNLTKNETATGELDLFEKISHGYVDSITLIDIADNRTHNVNESEKSLKKDSPFIMFYGPFELQPDKRNIHETELPTDATLLRIMVTGGNGNAYGCNEKIINTRKSKN